MANSKKNAEDDEYNNLILKKLGEKIKQLREAKGEFNYEKFALRNNIDRTQFWRYENGKDFRLTSLFKVLKALDISLAEFFKDGIEN